MSVTILGAGIRGLQQLTIEALQAMKSADRILTFCEIPAELAAGFGIDPEKIENLLHLYRNGAIDEDNYRRIIARIHAEARNHANVVVVVAGHPRIGVTFVQWLDSEGASLNPSTLPGISSFDTMLNDLKRDPLERGTQILEANRLLLFEQEINPTLDAYIYHVSSIGNRHTDYLEPQLRNQAAMLRQHLARFYPSDHRVVLIESASDSAIQAKLLEGTLQELERLLECVTYSSTLFIPATLPKWLNQEFLVFLRTDQRNGIGALT